MAANVGHNLHRADGDRADGNRKAAFASEKTKPPKDRTESQGRTVAGRGRKGGAVPVQPGREDNELSRKENYTVFSQAKRPVPVCSYNLTFAEPVGIRNAQSILRKATQSSLSHFHVAGMEKTYQQHSPTIAEAMDSRYSNTNTSAIFYVACSSSNVLPCAEIGRISRHLVGKKLSWFVTMIRSSLTELPEEENIWYESSNQEMFSKTVLRLYIDYTKLVQFDLTLKDIAELCFPDTQWHASPDWMGMIDLEIVGNYMTMILSKIDTVLCGDPRISSVHADIEERAPGAPKESRKDGGRTETQGRCDIFELLDSNKAIKVVTAGSDIMNISRLPNVYKLTIRSNHVLDVQKHLGIEAAANALRKIIDSDVISDFMTRTGTVLPFQNGSPEVFKKGALTAMAFERPRTHIRNFLRSSTWDEHPSVYADIIVGNNPSKITALPLTPDGEVKENYSLSLRSKNLKTGSREDRADGDRKAIFGGKPCAK